MLARRRPIEQSGTAVVTGASSGIGQAAALELARRGFRVLAGVRRDEDADAADRAGLIPLRLDVTDDDQVDRARRAVEGEGRGRLEVLVNSAGVAVAGPLEAIDTEALRAQLDINLLGVHRMIRALLPLLAAGGGTIINLSSISGRIGFPYLGAYVASKHALEGYSDALRRELSPHGVRVVLIEPGAVDTPMWRRSTPTADMIERLPERYRAEAGRVFAGMSRVGPRGAPAQRVAEVIARAATADRPRARYALPLGAAIQARLIPLLPEALVDRIADRRLGRR